MTELKLLELLIHILIDHYESGLIDDHTLASILHSVAGQLGFHWDNNIP